MRIRLFGLGVVITLAATLAAVAGTVQSRGATALFAEPIHPPGGELNAGRPSNGMYPVQAWPGSAPER